MSYDDETSPSKLALSKTGLLSGNTTFSIFRQANILGISRAIAYYFPRPVSRWPVQL
ncbi:hypothetical protein CEV33_3026 [Brucella grignonensis]|uniref:Uncharacterized protein n=1 Tax=Brucella grignonensis TaxID=94627 RepID=A0A256F1C6_9HYPH|nr:hypothetical protein CEV33_3026 [Brucella grignonensis]